MGLNNLFDESLKKSFFYENNVFFADY